MKISKVEGVSATPVGTKTPYHVAVIIAAYNAEATIERAIESALGEAEAAEIIVVDDASTDRTVDLARSMDDGSGRLKILSQTRNQGPSAARNRAIAASVSPWICVLDADDYFQSGRLRRLCAHLEGCDFVADDLLQSLESSPFDIIRLLSNGSIKQPQRLDLISFVEGNITRSGRQRGETGFLKPLMRRAFLNTLSGGYQENMRLGEDYELYARALASGCIFKVVPAMGYVSVVRSLSLSGRHTKEDLFNLRECDKGLIQLAKSDPGAQKALRRHYLSIDCRYQWRALIAAVKKRNMASALGTFFRPLPVPIYLAGKLVEEFRYRISRIGRSQTKAS